MRAITAVPGQGGSVGVEEVPEPAESDGGVLVRGLRWAFAVPTVRSPRGDMVSRRRERTG